MACIFIFKGITFKTVESLQEHIKKENKTAASSTVTVATALTTYEDPTKIPVNQLVAFTLNDTGTKLIGSYNGTAFTITDIVTKDGASIFNTEKGQNAAKVYSESFTNNIKTLAAEPDAQVKKMLVQANFSAFTITSYIANNITVAPTPVVNQNTTAVATAKTQEVKTGDDSASTLLSASDLVNLVKSFRAQKADDLDENARVRISENPKVKEDFEAFSKWIATRLNIPVEKVKHLIDGKNWGRFTGSAIQIFEGAGIGTGFHEAFEVVWNTYLTPEEQLELISEYTADPSYKSNPKYIWAKKNYPNLSENGQIKEALAEEFSEYIQSQNRKQNSPKRNSIFRKLWDFIRNLFNSSKADREQVESRINKLFKGIDSGLYFEASPKQTISGAKFNRAVAGASVQFSQELMEGMTGVFFSKLYTATNGQSASNVETLFSGSNPMLFEDLYQATFKTLDQVFNNEYNRIIEANPQFTPAQQAQIKEYLGSENSTYFYKQEVLKRFFEDVNEGDVKKEFKKYLGQFGLSFKDIPGKLNEESQEVIDNKEAAATDTLGIQQMIFVDPRSMTRTSVRLLIASLTADEYKNPNSSELTIQRNTLGLPKLEDYNKKINVLLNELHSVVPVFKNGELVSTLDGMFTKLDTKFKDNFGRYKKGYEWINRLKSRLNYEKNGTRIELETLNDDQVKLLIAFEASFSNNKNEPFKIIIGADNRVYKVDPIVTNNGTRIKENWKNYAKDNADYIITTDMTKAPFTYISNEGQIMFNTASEDFVKLSNAGSAVAAINALSVLGITFSKNIKSLIESGEAKEIAEAYSSIISVFKKGEINTFDDLFGKQIVNGPINRLIEIELKATAEDTILSHQTAAGKSQYSITLPSAASNIVNTLKGVNTLSDFILSNPQYGSVNPQTGEIILNDYQAGSQLLKKGGLFFNENGDKIKDLEYRYVLGMSSAVENEGSNTDDLTFPDKLTQEIFHILDGTYFSVINSDKSSEFGFTMGHFLSYEDVSGPIESAENLLNVYTEALRDEIYAAIAEHKQGSNVNNYSSSATSLGHFRRILGFIAEETKTEKYSALQKDFQKVLSEKMKVESFLANPGISDRIIGYLRKQVEEHKEWFISEGLVEKVEIENETSIYKTKSISKEQVNAITKGSFDVSEMSEVDYSNLIKFITFNRQLAVFEQHKLFYGHPGFYADSLAKRANGINSQKKPVVENQSLLYWMDKKKARFDGKNRSSEFNNDGQHLTFKHISYADPIAVSRYRDQIAEGMYESMKGDFTKAELEKMIGASFDKEGKVTKITGGKGTMLNDYLNLTEPDGGAFIMPDYFRDLMFLTGDLSKEQEDLLVYENAQEIVDRSKADINDPIYKLYSEDQINTAEEILKSKRPAAVLQVLKPQGFGFSAVEGLTLPSMLKHSVAPLTWSRVKGNPNMLTKYIQAQVNQVDIIGFESGQKVGAILNEDGSFTDLYDETGKAGEKMPVVQKMYNRYYGIQVAMADYAKDKVIFGTQMRKLNLSNLPAELKPAAEEYNTLLKELISTQEAKLYKSLGIKKVGEGFETDDLGELIETLRAEVIKRDLPDNVIDMINVVSDEFGQRLTHHFDASPIREKISNILNAIVDSRLISQKMHGKASVQVPATLYEKSPRDFMYVKDGVWTSLKGVDRSTLSPAESKSIRMVSSDLKFYTKPGKGEAAYMEVLLPHYFKGLPIITDAGTIDPKLLRAIGFRIPTQGLNSIEHIRIKGFLDPSMGDMVVVPSEIVGKSGSDFDIDKMNLFLANYYISSKTNAATYVEWKGSVQATREYYNELYDKGEFLTAEEKKEVDRYVREFNKQEKAVEKALSGIMNEKMVDKLTNLLSENEILEDVLATLESSEERKEKIVDQLVNKAIQNRLIEVMGDIVGHPSNYKQLITPNGAATTKALAEEIRGLKGMMSAKPDMTQLSEFKGMALTRERYISGKALVGVIAVQITSHTISQYGDVELTGRYKTNKKNPDGSSIYEDIQIKFDHSTDKGRYFINLIKGKDNRWISDMLSEAMTGAVDAAKDPFIFDLNLTLDTATTWFYLLKLGVPTKTIAYLHNQPVINDWFKNQSTNKSFVNKANEMEESFEELKWKTLDKYVTKAFNLNYSIYQMAKEGAADEGGPGFNPFTGQMEWVKPKMDAFKKQAKELDEMVKEIQVKNTSYAEDQLRNNIATLYKPGHSLTKQEAEQQIALLYDYLEYAQQAGLLSNYNKGISYDTARTKNLNENKLQRITYEKVLEEGFVTEESFKRVFDNTFLSKIKEIKDAIPEMFREFFVSLHPKAQPVFEKVLDELSNDGLKLSNNEKVEILNRFENFYINYLLHTVKIFEDGKTYSANQYYKLFFKDNSLASDLKKYKDRYPENPALKQLFPIISTDVKFTNNIKLFNTKLSTYEVNLISEGLQNLVDQATENNDKELLVFTKKLGIFAILQSGVQKSPIAYTQILPGTLYSDVTNDIFTRFSNNDIDISPEIIWKQFHQNYWFNINLTPRTKDPVDSNGLLRVSRMKANANRDYLLKRVLTTEYAGKKNAQLRETMYKQGRGEEMFTNTLFEKVKFFNDENVDITDTLETAYYKPIPVLGNKMYMTEVSTYDLDKSIVQTNTPVAVNPKMEQAIEKIRQKAVGASVNPTGNNNVITNVATREYTPEKMTKDNMPVNGIFVFGSNTEGRHGLGAANDAKRYFGAKQFQPTGLQGNAYGIVTKNLTKGVEFDNQQWNDTGNKSVSLEYIGKGIQNMLLFAKANPLKKFYVTKLGSSLAGYSENDIKGLFEKLINVLPDNVILPKEYEVRNTNASEVDQVLARKQEESKKCNSK